MTPALKIDFVSDIACPWCAVGLASLERALQRLQSEGITAQVHFQPFQLNPQMGPEGQDLAEHLTEKYGSTPAQQAANWQALCQRAAAVGGEFARECTGGVEGGGGTCGKRVGVWGVERVSGERRRVGAAGGGGGWIGDE